MKIAALVSGGKDSIYAAYQASKNNKLVCLITIKSTNQESYMFHIPNIDLVKLQAKSMNLPLIFKKTQGIKEEELKDLENAIKLAIKKYKIQGLVSGAIESKYQKERIENICKKFNIKSITPLWHKDQLEYLYNLIKDKFEVIITAIAAEGFNESWLNRKLDKKAIKEIEELKKKYSINPSFEGGEAETFVLWCPLFKKRLKIIKSERIMENQYSGYLDIQEIK